MYPLSISQNCKEFLDSCLKYNPEERSKVPELLHKPFITSYKIDFIHKYLVRSFRKHCSKS